MSINQKHFGLSDSLVNAVNEALHPNQKKLDVAEPKGKLDAKDFKKLRGEGSKPDFIDIDKDGNKTEPMKKASKEIKEDDAHFAQQSKKMQDAINMHLRKGKSYADAAKAAKFHVKEEVEIEEGFVVRYNNPKSEKHGSEKHFDDQVAAKNHATRGNLIDKVGGKYTVHKTNEKGHDVKEEALDELSKNTLGSYAAKAHKQGDMAARMSNGGQKKDMSAIANKRYQGVQTAIKKMREETLDEKAVSQAQQKAAGAALATQRGEYAGGKKGGAVNRMALMKRAELEKIAATKRKGLPMRKEEAELDEADSYSIKNTKTDNTYHISKYPITANHTIYKKIKAKDPQAQIHKNGQPIKEEVEELDELSKATLGSYAGKAAMQRDDSRSKQGLLSVPVKDRKAHAVKAFQRAQGVKKAISKLGEDSINEADDAIAKQISAKKDAMKKQIQQKIAQKQMSVLQQKAQKKIQTIKAGTENCSCGSTNESKMRCEVHGDNKKLKGGKEPIEINPPLKEAKY